MLQEPGQRQAGPVGAFLTRHVLTWPKARQHDGNGGHVTGKESHFPAIGKYLYSTFNEKTHRHSILTHNSTGGGRRTELMWKT